MLSDQARHELHNRLEGAIGTESAGNLMASLPPFDWHEVARREDVLAAQAMTEAKLEHLTAKVERVETRLDRVEDRLDRVDDRLDRVETRLDRVDDRLDGVETRLDRVEDRLDRVEQKVDRIEDHMIRIDGRLASIDESVGKTLTKMWLVAAANAGAMLGVVGVVLGAIKIFG